MQMDSKKLTVEKRRRGGEEKCVKNELYLAPRLAKLYSSDVMLGEKEKKIKFHVK